MLAAWLCQVSPLSQSAADTNNHLTPCYNNSFIGVVWSLSKHQTWARHECLLTMDGFRMWMVRPPGTPSFNREASTDLIHSRLGWSQILPAQAMVCIMKAVSQATARYSPLIGHQTLVPLSDWPGAPAGTGRENAAMQGLSLTLRSFLKYGQFFLC